MLDILLYLKKIYTKPYNNTFSYHSDISTNPNVGPANSVVRPLTIS